MNVNPSEFQKVTLLQILQALERRPMTIENLAYSFAISEQEMFKTAKNLLNEGYIYNTSSNSIKNIGVAAAIGAAAFALSPLSLLATGVAVGFLIGKGSNELFRSKSSQNSIEIDNTSTYFTLSPKGHFYLHPITSSEGTK